MRRFWSETPATRIGNCSPPRCRNTSPPTNTKPDKVSPSSSITFAWSSSSARITPKRNCKKTLWPYVVMSRDSGSAASLVIVRNAQLFVAAQANSVAVERLLQCRRRDDDHPPGLLANHSDVL